MTPGPELGILGILGNGNGCALVAVGPVVLVAIGEIDVIAFPPGIVIFGNDVNPVGNGIPAGNENDDPAGREMDVPYGRGRGVPLGRVEGRVGSGAVNGRTGFMVGIPPIEIGVPRLMPPKALAGGICKGVEPPTLIDGIDGI